MQNQTKLTPQIEAMKNAYLQGIKVSDEEIAKASMTVLDEYRCHPLPTPPKRVYTDYLDLKPPARALMNKSPENYLGFWNDPEVKGYFDQRLKIKNLNERNKNWLKWLMKVLPDEELPIRMKLHSFEDVPPAIDQPEWSN